MPDSPFLTVSDVAALLRVPVSWVYSQTARRGNSSIRRYRAGRHLVFVEREVLDWFTSTQRVGMTFGRGRLPRRRGQPRHVLAGRNGRAPDSQADGQRTANPGRTRLSENLGAARALSVPQGD